jgi:hypothetical protein
LTRVAVASFVFGACVAALRVLGMAGFSNDHFYYLSRAEQVLHGAWPVRDFIDPGIPLAWGLSVMGQIVGGHTLLSEAVLVAMAFGLSAGLTAWVVARWTGVAWLGFWAAFVQLAILPRSYSYPKILAYVLAAAAFTRYARAPSRTRDHAAGGRDRRCVPLPPRSRCVCGRWGRASSSPVRRAVKARPANPALSSMRAGPLRSGDSATWHGLPGRPH